MEIDAPWNVRGLSIAEITGYEHDEESVALWVAEHGVLDRLV